MKKSKNYWKDRFEQLEDAQMNKGAKYYDELQKIYQRAGQAVSDDIYKWYARFAKNNDMNMAEARKLLKSDELEEFRWNVLDYIKYGEENGITGEWAKQLENASAKWHISRLEAIEIQMQNHVETLFGKEYDDTRKLLERIYTDGYYHTAFELQKGFEIGYSFMTIDKRRIEKVLSKPWAADGVNFSERIWKHKNVLINELHTHLSQAIIQGKSPKVVTDIIAERFKVSKGKAGRLVMTETAYIASVSTKDAFEELGVEEYEILATLDKRTSPICQEMDGKHFPMSQFQVGVTAPPLHVFCRSTTIPYFDDEFEYETAQRAARNADGKTYYVPADTTYKEWKKAFVDGDEFELNHFEKDDKILLKNNISKQNDKIEELKKQFSDETDGYSYDEWFKDFSSIEEGYGDVSSGDESFEKLKKLDQEIRGAEEQRLDLLTQKEKRGQLDTGYPGKIPDDKLDEYNQKAFEQIKIDTGYSDEKAEEFHNALKEYFGGNYETILKDETEAAKIISDGLDRMPVYEGTVYRGLCFSESSDYDISEFTRLKMGDELPSKGMISSWSSDKRVAEAFGSVSTQSAKSSAVILECLENKTGVGVQHLSKYGSREAEVLCSSKYEVIEIVTESKYDYVSRRKDLLYFPDDLTDLEDELKKQVVCMIKVKER